MDTIPGSPPETNRCTSGNHPYVRCRTLAVPYTCEESLCLGATLPAAILTSCMKRPRHHYITNTKRDSEYRGEACAASVPTCRRQKEGRAVPALLTAPYSSTRVPERSVEILHGTYMKNRRRQCGSPQNLLCRHKTKHWTQIVAY